MEAFKEIVLPIVQFIGLISPLLLWIIKDIYQTHDMLNNTSKKIDDLNEKLIAVEVVAIRNELQSAMDHNFDISTISSIYDRYQAAGGNSYMKAEYEAYLEDKKEDITCD